MKNEIHKSKVWNNDWVYFIASSIRSQNIYSQNQWLTPTKNDVHEITLKIRQDNNNYIFMILRDLSMMVKILQTFIKKL